MDVGDGTVFGQHALAYAVLAYAAEYFRRRVLRFPLWQQAAQVAVLLLAVRGARAAGARRRRRADAALDLRGAAARRRAAVAGALGRAAVAAAAAALARRSVEARRMARRSSSARAVAGTTAASARRSCAIRSAKSSCSGGAWASPARWSSSRSAGCSRASSTCRSSSTSHYQTLAETNRIAIVPIVPNRGVITDRNGVVLAQSYSAYTLEIHAVAGQEPRRDDRRARATSSTSSRATASASASCSTNRRISRACRCARASPTRRWRASPSTAIAFRASRSRRGCSASTRTARSPRTSIGYIGRINERDVERIDEWDETANYKGSDYIGKVGVELSYERELHGTTGVEEVEVDAGGRAVRTLSRTPPVSGNNLRAVARHQAAGGRREGVRRSPRRAGGDRPCDRRRARVRVEAGLRSQPVRRRHRSRELGDAERLARQAAAQSAACAAPIRPGSTIKPFLALVALTSGKRTPQQTIFDPGYFQIPGQAHRFRDDKPGGHGTVDMYKSIVVSCDTYYYMLASETDIDDTARFLSQLGFGAEDRHRHRRRADRRAAVARMEARSASRAANTARSIASGTWATRISAGIGQGYNAFTPMQLAHAIATIANDGVAFRPHLVKNVREPAHGRGARGRAASRRTRSRSSPSTSRSSRTRSSASTRKARAPRRSSAPST